MILRRLLIVFLFLACIAASVGFFWFKYLDTPLTVTKPSLVYVAPGSSIEKVAANLQRDGYTRYPMLFILLARLQGNDKLLKAGEYQLVTGMTPEQFLYKVVKGKVYLRRYTIVEGWTLKQVLAGMNNNPYLKHTIATSGTLSRKREWGSDELNPLNLSADIAKQIGINQANLEGFLNPDTYLFAAGVPDIVILKKAYLKMQNNLNRYWQDRSADLPFQNTYDVLIAASLIEKETAKNDERSKIAGVIVRRLQNNMRLQIDASVIYGLGEQYQGKLTHDDLKIDTPYNTYLHEGLPPTPIAMPSILSIIAALHPTAGTELFYVTRGDGSHEFSSTLAQHIAAIKKYHPSLLPPESDAQPRSLLQTNPTEEIINHPLYPRSHWDEKLSNQNLFAAKSVDMQQSVPKKVAATSQKKSKTDKSVKLVSKKSAPKSSVHDNIKKPKVKNTVQKTKAVSLKKVKTVTPKSPHKSSASHEVGKNKGNFYHH